MKGVGEHELLHIPFSFELDNDKTEFLAPIIYEFPEENEVISITISSLSTKTLKNETIPFTMWIQSLFNDTSTLELILLYYPKHINSIELLWMLNSIKQNQGNEEKTNKFNEIIEKWIKSNYHHEWCCTEEETISNKSNQKFPKTNLKKEALKLINNENIINLLNSVTCLSEFMGETDEFDENEFFEPKSLLDYKTSHIVSQFTRNSLFYLKNFKMKSFLHPNYWKTEKTLENDFIWNFNIMSAIFVSEIVKLETSELRSIYISKLIDICMNHGVVKNYQILIFVLLFQVVFIILLFIDYVKLGT